MQDIGTLILLNKYNNLKIISLKDCMLTAQGMTQILEKHIFKCANLDLSFNKLSAVCLRNVVGNRKHYLMNDLECLKLIRCSLRDEFMEMLGLVNMPNIRILDISLNYQLSDNGIEDFACA